MSKESQNLKEKILSLALKEIVDKGVESLSLRELAKKLNVSHSAPYRHFASKDLLIEALAQEGFGKLYALMEKSVLQTTSPQEKLYQLGYAYVEFSLENPEHFSLMYGVNKNPVSVTHYQNSHNSVYDFLKNVIHENVEARIYRWEDLDKLTFAAWSYLHGLATLWHQQKNAKDNSILSESLKSYMALFEKGLLS